MPAKEKSAISFDVIRADESHRPHIAQLLTETKIGTLEGPLDDILVAVRGGEFIGCGGIFYINKRAACLNHIAVKKELRRRGIASAIIARLIENAEERNVHLLSLCSMYYRFNFYKHRGFRVMRRDDLPEDLRAYEQFTDKKYMKCAVMVRGEF